MVVKVAAPGRSFAGVAAYCLHDTREPGEPQPETSKRVEWTDTRNLPTDRPDRAAAMMAAAAQAMGRQWRGEVDTPRPSPSPGRLQPGPPIAAAGSSDDPDPVAVTTIYMYNKLMEFEWDEAKNRTNIRKHGSGFDTAKRIFEERVTTSPDRRRDYGEDRHISIGRVKPGVLIVVAHTERHGRIRLISARPASRKEKESLP